MTAPAAQQQAAQKPAVPSDLERGLHEVTKAGPGYNKAQAYADGPVNEIFISRKIRRIMHRSGINFQEILGDVVIDAVADRLSIDAVQADDDNATAAITAMDEANALPLIRPQLNRLTLKFGDYYLFAWPQEDKSLRVVMIDPRQARLFYDTDNPTTPRYGIRWWVREDKHKRVDLLYGDRVESFISIKADRYAREAKYFRPYTVEGNSSHVVKHDFGRPPLFHFSTDLPGEYGCPEHKRFYPTQDILIKLAVSHMVSVDYTTLPQRYAIMAEGADTTEAEDQDDTVFRFANDGTDPEARVHEREGVSSLRSEPGELWFQKGIKSFGEFQAASPAGFLDPAVHHLKIGATASATPLWYFEGFGNQPAAGVALTRGMEPLLAKCRARLATLDHDWKTFYGTCLAVLGYPKAKVALTWAPIEPRDEQATFATATAKQEAGVPVDVTLKESGYDEAIVDGWQKTHTMAIEQRMALLSQVSDSLDAMSTAVAGGVVDPPQAMAIIQKIIGPLDTIDGVDSDDPAGQ